jgi:hypothetical protein
MARKKPPNTKQTPPTDAIRTLKPCGDSDRCGLSAAENSTPVPVMPPLNAASLAPVPATGLNMDCRGAAGNAD